MNYKLCKSCKVIQDNNELIILNEIENSEIGLDGITKSEFEDVLNGNKLLKLLEDIKIKNDDESINRLKDFNALIYVLLDQKIIEPDNEYDYLDKKIWVKSCLIELTDGCNFRCPHCYVDKSKYNRLTLEDIKNLAQELLALKCNKVTLTGGEVLTHNEFKQIYQHLYKMGFVIGVNTNGSLFNNEIIEMFKEMPPFVVEISLYGYDNSSYNVFTKTKNQFDVVVSNVKKLKDTGIKLILKNVITNSNKQHFSKIRDVAKKLDVEFRSDYISFPQINSKFEQNKEQISVKDAILSLKMQPNAKEYFINLYNSYQKDDGYIFKCKKMDDSLFVNSKLDVCMCICLQSFSVKYEKGNLLKCVSQLQDFRLMKYDASNKCKDCRLMSICRYCPAKFYLTTGSYQVAPKWFCDYANQVYSYFIKGVSIIRKRYISEENFDTLFKIIKNNMINIGVNVVDEDKKFWVDNIDSKLRDDKFFFYIIFYNGEICGFIEAVDSDNELIVAEIQLDAKVKGSRMILRVIEFMLNNKKFANYDNIKFSINKKNNMSNKTFGHLGAKIYSENEKSFRYELTRNQVERYVKKINHEL